MDLQQIFDRFAAAGFSGSALVRHGAETLLDAAAGLADRERAIPNRPGTAFQIASISKQFTAAAVLLLQERGALSVQDRICRWLPDCPDPWRPVTIHHLLTHTSGIGHWGDFPDLSLFEPNTIDGVIDTFRRGACKFPPGTDWAYSSPAYVLLAHIVELAAGRRYADFLSENIFHPLEMTSTGAGSRAPDPSRQAAGYADTHPVRSFELAVVGMGAGDIWSTVGDMARWDRAVSAPGLLRAPTLRAMFSPYATTTQPLPDGSPTQYGYGWSLGELGGHRVRFHTGGNAGFQSVNARFDDGDTILIVLTNDERADLEGLTMQLAAGLLGRVGHRG
jgi:CubicO group peptidase (beta-lactamase class C family)